MLGYFKCSEIGFTDRLHVNTTCRIDILIDPPVGGEMCSSGREEGQHREGEKEWRWLKKSGVWNENENGVWACVKITLKCFFV